jgi:hypothetical protein
VPQLRRRLPPNPSILSYSAWSNGKLLAFSALETAQLPDGSGVGLQFHISISANGKRVDSKTARRALAAFRLQDAEEDNHEPGVAKHFWLPVDPEHRVDCECKATEVQVTEADGHRWSSDRDPAKCGGCALAAIKGGSCPVHGVEVSNG